MQKFILLTLTLITLLMPAERVDAQASATQRTIAFVKMLVILNDASREEAESICESVEGTLIPSADGIGHDCARKMGAVTVKMFKVWFDDVTDTVTSSAAVDITATALPQMIAVFGVPTHKRQGNVELWVWQIEQFKFTVVQANNTSTLVIERV
jgi:hypothetical protein